MQDVIRMTYDAALCQPDEITKIWSLSRPDYLAIPSISSGWLIVDTLCHPDHLPGVGISSGWITANSLCHPDDMLFHFMSSGWLNWGWLLIRMSYGNVIMSSGWDTLPFLSHPDEIVVVREELSPKGSCHNDVTKWKHLPRCWPFVSEIRRSSVNSPHKGKWRGALMFSLICARTNGWVNHREAGDLRRHRAHYDVTVIEDSTWRVCARSSQSPYL